MSAQTAITIDVEWAHPEVLDFVVRELDSRRLRATFFCTHAGIELSGHERALHPNFRRHGNSLLDGSRREIADRPDIEFYQYIAQASHAFCPEAVGSRSHNLFWDSALASICRGQSLKYTSNAFLPLAAGLAPVEQVKGLVELPIYYMDHWDMVEGVTGFHPGALQLGREGLKVFDFHPNLLFINARSAAHYLESKKHYHDPERLKALRAPGRGALTLFLELLDHLAQAERPPVLLREIEAAWRNQGAA